VRAGFRLARVGLHLAYGIATVALVYPWLAQAGRLALKRRWSRQLLEMLGLQMQVSGGGIAAPCLVVANHVSWLDVFAINAVAPAAFVCKDDVRDWPVIGWLVARTDSIFIERGRRSAARHAAAGMRAALGAGMAVAVFPEGTTSDGGRVLPFHAGLLQPAIDTGCPVQPVALRYRDASGAHSDAPAYIGDVTLWQTLRSIALASGLQVELDMLAPLTAAAERRALAAAARHAIERRVLDNRRWPPAGARATLDAGDSRIEGGAHELTPAENPV